MSNHSPHPEDDDEVEDLSKSESEVQTEAARHGGIQVDGYKIKADIRPVDIGEKNPQSWEEVGEAVNSKLRSIAVNLFGVLEDGLIGSRKFIRGLAEIPGAVARRVDRAHDKADRGEGKKQEQLAERTLALPSPESTVDRVEACLLELQAKGIPVELRQLPDGRMGIIIVRPELQDAATDLIQQALPEPLKVVREQVFSSEGLIAQEKALKNLSDIPIEDLRLSMRLMKLLKKIGVDNVAQLTNFSAGELMAAKNFGITSLNDLRDKLAAIGIKLNGD